MYNVARVEVTDETSYSLIYLKSEGFSLKILKEDHDGGLIYENIMFSLQIFLNMDCWTGARFQEKLRASLQKNLTEEVEPRVDFSKI